MAREIKRIERCLIDLCNGKDDQEQLVEDIALICPNQLTVKNIECVCTLLFDKEIGVTTFLRRNNELSPEIRAELLAVLANVEQKFGKYLHPYTADLKGICMLLFNQDKSAKVKNAALELLILVLENSRYYQISELDIPGIIKKFFLQLANPSKLTLTVRAKIYLLFGTLANHHPEFINDYAKKLFDIYLSAMAAEFRSTVKKPEFLVIAACLEGCNKLLLKHMPYDPEDDVETYYKLFLSACNAIKPDLDLSRYEMPKASLSLFENHSALFIQFLQDDYKKMYDIFLKWFHHKNRELANHGQWALEAFIYQISRAIVEENADASQKPMFEFFLKKSNDIIKNKDSTKKEIEIAIKCFGLLGGPCKKFHTQDDVNFMFREMLEHSKHLFVKDSENFHDQLYSLCGYLEALSSILKEVDCISDESLKIIEHLLVVMIENFPHIYYKYHFKCVRAILKVLLALMPKETHLHEIMRETVYQGLLRMSCLATPLEEIEQPQGTGTFSVWGIKKQKQVSYKDYISLWSNLLKSSSLKELSTIGYSFSDREKLTQLLYDEILSSVIHIIESLDLTVNTNISQDVVTQPSTSSDSPMDTPTVSADPVYNIKLNCVQDHQVFYNIINFCCEFLNKNEKKMFEKWLFRFCNFLVKISTSTPLVSGFHRLLTVSMKIARDLHYFEGISIDNLKITENSSQTNAEKIACFILMKKYSKEILVQLKQYKEELLAACLTLVLSLPIELIVDQIGDLLPAIQMSLSIGLTYLPLTNAAMDTLECWTEGLSQDVLKTVYSQVLPHLDPFIRSSEKGFDDIDLTNIETKKKRYILDPESELSKIKYRIAKYLGNIGGNFNRDLLANSDQDVLKYAVAWDTKKHLKFDLPFTDMRPTIYLDPFLPPILELATKSSDRQTKVAACEFLHSAVLYSLGQSVRKGSFDKSNYRFSFEMIYKNIFPVLLQLACDLDQVPKQLFETLVFQLIHWFTSNQKFENAESMSLLDAIYDGIIQSKDTSLRDFCAKCIAEFFKWSLKRKSSEKNPVNVTSVLTRLYSYTLHPDPFKRLGAALAFNNFYVIFREHDMLIDQFVFNLLVHFVKSLALCHKDDQSLGVHSQCCKALDHLERIILKKADMLRKVSSARKHPSLWNQITLPYAVRWLVRQCGRPQTSCRHTCMKLVYNLAPHIQGINQPEDYFKIFYEKEGQNYFIERFEGGGEGSDALNSIKHCPQLKIKEHFSLQKICQWFDYFLAGLDCYIWVFENNLLSPEQMLQVAESNSTQIFEAVCYFLEYIALSDLKTLTKNVNADCLLFTPKEEDEFKRNKCTVIIRIFSFLTTVLKKCKDAENSSVIPNKVWTPHLWKLICECVLQPEYVGFNLTDLEVVNKLPDELQNLLNIFLKRLPAEYKQQMRELIKNQLVDQRNLLAVLPIPLKSPNVNYFKLQQLLTGYHILNKVKLLDDMDLEDLAAKLLQNVCQNVVIHSGENQLTSRTLTPTELTLTQTLLELAIQLSMPIKVFMKVIFTEEAHQQNTSRGEILLCVFKQEVSGYIIEHAAELIPLIMAKSNSNSQLVGHILILVLDILKHKRSKWKQSASQVCGIILSNWHMIENWWRDDASEDTQRVAFDILLRLLHLDSKVLSDSENPTCVLLHKFFCILLSNKTVSSSFKVSLLDLLPFLSVSPEPLNSQLRTNLDRFLIDKSRSGTLLYDTYISLLDKILFALKKSKSKMILELLIKNYCQEEKHCHEKDIHNCLETFIKRVDQKSYVQIPFDLFLKTRSYTNNFRKLVIKKVCLPFLRNMSKISLVEFLKSNIHAIMDIVEAEIVQLPVDLMEQQLTDKMCCFEILEVMYTILDVKKVNDPGSEVNFAYCKARNIETQKIAGKELTKAIIKISHQTKKEDMHGETLFLELRRQVHCAAYNLLIAIISCTQTDLKFYNVFLFAENEEKKEFLLDNVIDKEIKYSFPIAFELQPKKKTIFLTLHKEIKQKVMSDASQPASYHLSSVYLENSSLSVDIGRYDYLSSNVEHQEIASVSKEVNSANSSAESEEKTMDYSLEMDEINQSECMLPLVAVLKHMYRQNITPKENKEMPPWMSYLHKKFTNSSTHLNIKLFIAKLIVNTAEIFEKYASFWVLPLSEFIFCENFEEKGINYFVLDIIVMFLSWGEHSIPGDSSKERYVASCLVHFIIRNIYNANRSIFRNNLKLLEALIGHWKARIDILYNCLYEMMISSDPDSGGLMVGVQLLGVLLKCNFSPYVNTTAVPREKYFNQLFRGLHHSSKTVYAATAEVLGLSLKYFDQHKDSEFENFISQIESVMKKLEPKLGNFIVCLHKMQLHYPPVAKRYLPKLLYHLTKLHGDFQLYCLEILLGNINNIESAFKELKSKNLLSFFTHRDKNIRLTSLNIVKALLAKLKPNELAEIFSSIDHQKEEPWVECRKVLYDILMWVYDNYGEETSEESGQVMSCTLELLLKGLEDKDYSCRVLVHNFWSNRTRLPESTFDRMAAMLQTMYSPRTEHQFLYYSSSLLLEMTSKSPEYNREIFEYPLAECKFKEYKVKSSWQHRHSTMTPLFYEALSSSYMEVDDSKSENMDTDELRATYDGNQQFTPTQDAPYDWITQTSLSFSMEVDSVDSGVPSSLLTVSGKATAVSQVNPTRKRPGPGFGQKRLSAIRDSQEDPLNENSQSIENKSRKFAHLKNRVLKDRATQNLYFAKKQIIKNETQVQLAHEQKSKRENQVTLYRKYRTGDLPDIQIKYSSLIATLQVVALRDSTVARLLFNSLFKGIFVSAKDMKKDEDMERSILLIQKSIELMLKASEQHFPPFISCMLNILYDMEKELPIDIKQLISSSAITAKLQPLAITVLEEQIIEGMNSCQPSEPKKSRQYLNPPSTDVSTWLELARLYKSINEYDSVLGIFKDNVGCPEDSKMAIEAEIRGAYSEASKYYVKAELSTNSDEIDIWRQCYIQCLENLSRWDKVEKETVQLIDPKKGDFTKVWENSSNQENYLQPLIQSKLKLMQQQDENQTEFLKFIDDALKSPYQSNILEHQFSKELSLMFLWQENYDRALIYINNAIQQFLLEWSNTDILMKSRRIYLLQNLQILSEIESFLSFIKNKEKIKSCSSINQLFNCWEKQTPSLLEDPVKVWDDVITNRLKYINQITIERNKPEYSNAMDTSEGNYFPKEFKLTLQLLRAESCCEQNNFKLARTILKEISGECKHISLMKLKLKWNHLYIQSYQKKNQPFKDICTNLVNNLTFLCEHDLSLLPPEEQSLKWKHNVLYGEHLSLLASVLKDDDGFQFENLPFDIKEKIASYAGHEYRTTQELSQKLIISGCEYLKKNVISDDSEEQSVSVRESIGETHLAIAKYCNQFLQDSPSLGNTLMSSLLKAIRYGIKEAQQRFCHLLQLFETHTESIDIFINESKTIPCWMFLNWINQMISLLDKPNAYAVHDIVYKIACEYPQAIIYSFKISKEGFRFEENDIGTRNREFVEKLSRCLNSLPLVFTFISSLESFAQPFKVFKDWFRNSYALLGKTNPEKQRVIEDYKDMHSALFENSCEENVSSYYREFTQNFQSSFLKSFGKDGSKINKMNAQAFKKEYGSICKDIENHGIKEPKALAEFSSWMSNFDPLIDTLEIPGQYHGFNKPLLEYHIKISGFDQQVQTFQSIQKPRKIIIRGNDQKEYPFIVKCGEDLRQDQRIEQLSEVINEIFKKNSICRTKKLQLKTYQIIPMSTRVGLLECLENVVTLQNTLERDLTSKERDKYFKETYMKHLHFKNKFNTKSAPRDIFKKCSKSEAELEYQRICAAIPWDLLRRSFKKMSTSPEAFHVLRTGFTTSHAVLCICHYILGVGDRHLSNLMIHQGTGQMIGIDFGHAFGSATQYLPIPELIPFRLTRQLQNVCLPHGTKGIFEGTMVHCLEALRSDKDLLIHTLEIFVREPSLDWLKNAQKNMHRKTQDFSEEEDLSWYPREKIDCVKRKLDGEHPAYITRDELALNSYIKDVLKHITSSVLGTEGNVRYALPQKHLTVEQQTAAVIDLATDPNILIRTYEGWNPLI